MSPRCREMISMSSGRSKTRSGKIRFMRILKPPNATPATSDTPTTIPQRTITLKSRFAKLSFFET